MHVSRQDCVKGATTVFFGPYSYMVIACVTQMRNKWFNAGYNLSATDLNSSVSRRWDVRTLVVIFIREVYHIYILRFIYPEEPMRRYAFFADHRWHKHGNRFFHRSSPWLVSRWSLGSPWLVKWKLSQKIILEWNVIRTISGSSDSYSTVTLEFIP